MPLFDYYSLRARLQPALLTLLPLALAVFAWTGARKPWMAGVWTLCGTAGATFFLSVLVRNRGKQIESLLWASWGGAPTTQLLRHRGPANPLMRARWHKYLAKVLAVQFPDADEEAINPAAADQAYEAATKVLIAKTRDTKRYSLLFKENVGYGFCRNVYAMRRIGIFVAAVGTLASAVAAYSATTSDMRIIAGVCTGLSVVFLLCWAARVNADWVKVPAFAYAERLFESTESLSRAKAGPPPANSAQGAPANPTQGTTTGG